MSYLQIYLRTLRKHPSQTVVSLSSNNILRKILAMLVAGGAKYNDEVVGDDGMTPRKLSELITGDVGTTVRAFLRDPDASSHDV